MSSLLPGEELTEEQVHEAEEEIIVEALSPLYDPRVRQKILDAKSSFEQVIDETTPDELLAAGYDEDAARKARDLIGGFGAIYGAFGDDLTRILDELNERLAA